MIGYTNITHQLSITTSAAISTDVVICSRAEYLERNERLVITENKTTADTFRYFGRDYNYYYYIAIESINIVNRHASTAQTITIGLYNGTITTNLFPPITLAAGESLVYDNGLLSVITSTGASRSVDVGTKKMLGQAAPSATTETTLYTVPAGKSARCGMLMACNRGAAAATFRVSISVGGGATANKDYIYYDLTIAAYDSFLLDLLNGVNVSATDIIRVYASTGDMSFNLSGEEF
jgi:hypothetical protein